MSAILPIDRPRLARELGATIVLAAPLVLGQLSAIGMNVVDTMLAGHLDGHTLGAVAVGTNVWVLAIVIVIGVMMALQPSVAQLHGAGRVAEIGPLFRQALWIAIPLGVALAFVVALAGPLLFGLIGVDAALVADAGGFLNAVAFGAPALTLFFALRGLSEGLGLTRPTMWFSLLGLALLAPIGYVLMYGAFGLPRLGARGCGMATAIVLWLQCLAFTGYVAVHPRYRAVAPFARCEAADPRAIGALLWIGVPMAVTLFMEASLFVAVALLLGSLGTAIVASHQIAINVVSVAFMVPLGIALATTVRVGHAVGRGEAAGVRLAAGASLLLTAFVQVVSALLLAVLASRIAALYTIDAAISRLAAELIVLAAIFQLSDGIQAVANGSLRGLKDTRVPMFLTLFAYWGVGMPVGHALAFRAGHGAHGMWYGLIAGLSVAALLLSWRFWRLTARRPAAVT